MFGCLSVVLPGSTATTGDARSPSPSSRGGGGGGGGDSGTSEPPTGSFVASDRGWWESQNFQIKFGFETFSGRCPVDPQHAVLTSFLTGWQSGGRVCRLVVGRWVFVTKGRVEGRGDKWWRRRAGLETMVAIIVI